MHRNLLATVAVALLLPAGVSATTSFSIVSQVSHECLDIQGPQDKNGAQISTSKCDAGEPKDGQVWIFRKKQLVHFTASGQELCLDIPQNNRVNGQTLQLRHCKNSEQQQFVFTNTSELRTVNGSMCLDLRAEDGHTVQLWDCDGFSANQRWIMKRVANPTMTASVSIKGSKCLDLTEGEEKSGTAVQTWDCDVERPDAAQTWILRDLQIIHRSADGNELCLDIPENNRTNGQQLQVWECNGREQQNFLNQDGKFKTLDGKKCLDLREEDETTVQLYDCLDTENQQWMVTRLPDKKTTTKSPSPTTEPKQQRSVSVSSGVFSACLDLTDGNETDGTPMQVWECDPDEPDAAQVWRFTDGQLVHHTAWGYAYCLDIPENNRTDGVQLQVWTCSGEEQQQWVYESGSIKTLDGSQCVDLRSEDLSTVQLWTCNESPSQQWVLTQLKPSPSPGPKSTSTAASTTPSKSTTSDVKTTLPTTKTSTAPPTTTDPPKPKPTTTVSPKPKGQSVSISSEVWFGCVDLAGDAGEGTLVKVTACDPDAPSASQTWTFAGGQLFHESSGGALCLSVPEGKMQNGQQLRLSSCDGSKHQQFSFKNGELRTKSGEKCVDLKEQDSTTVQLMDCDDSVNQEWVLTEVATSLEAVSSMPAFFLV